MRLCFRHVCGRGSYHHRHLEGSHTTRRKYATSCTLATVAGTVFKLANNSDCLFVMRSGEACAYMSSWIMCASNPNRPRLFHGCLAISTLLPHSAWSPAYASAASRLRWSGQRDSNPQPPPWQGGALPSSYDRELAPLEGFKPPTCRFEAGRSIRLSYRGRRSRLA